MVGQGGADKGVMLRMLLLGAMGHFSTRFLTGYRRYWATAGWGCCQVFGCESRLRARRCAFVALLRVWPRIYPVARINPARIRPTAERRTAAAGQPDKIRACF